MNLAGILNKEGEILVKRIGDNIVSAGKEVSGATRSSVSWDVSEQSGNPVLEVYATRPYFRAIETGSKPSTKNPSPEMVMSLKEWAQARNIPAPPFAIAKTILKDGSKLWQEGGRTDIYTDEIEKFTEELTQKIINEVWSS
jgi:hypothetical protein